MALKALVEAAGVLGGLRFELTVGLLAQLRVDLLAGALPAALLGGPGGGRSLQPLLSHCCLHSPAHPMLTTMHAGTQMKGLRLPKAQLHVITAGQLVTWQVELTFSLRAPSMSIWRQMKFLTSRMRAPASREL